MKHISVLLFCIMTTIFSSAFGITYQSYTDSKHGISIKYPSTWEFVENPKTIFMFIRPIEREGQVFRENVNLIISSSQGLSLPKYAEAANKQLNVHLKEYKELGTQKVILGDKEFIKVVYEHSIEDLRLKVDYYIHIHKGKVYQFTCSAYINEYANYAPVFEEIVRSVQIN